MIRNLKLFSVLLLTLFLASCELPRSTAPEPVDLPPIAPVPIPPQPEPPPPDETVPAPPKLRTIDWDASVKPLVDQMMNTQGVEQGSILLVDQIKNNTNGTLLTAKATKALSDAFASGHRFSLVPGDKLNQAKQTFGLSEQDSLTSRSKAIGLARYLGAQYVLYSSAEGEVKSPELEMQLMLVETGEIIWAGNGKVSQH